MEIEQLIDFVLYTLLYINISLVAYITEIKNSLVAID